MANLKPSVRSLRAVLNYVSAITIKKSKATFPAYISYTAVFILLDVYTDWITRYTALISYFVYFLVSFVMLNYLAYHWQKWSVKEALKHLLKLTGTFSVHYFSLQSARLFMMYTWMYYYVPYGWTDIIAFVFASVVATIVYFKIT